MSKANLDTKTIPDVGAIYLYEEAEIRKPRNRFPFVNYFRKKLHLDENDLEDKRKAVVKKSGHYRVRYTGLSGHRSKFLSDLYVTLVDLKWRYALAIFFNVYLLCFLIFGVFWWLIAYNHGDFDNVNNPDWRPCISTVYSFPKCLLFSIETQTTIGYGVAYPNTDCDGTLFMVFMQITVGILLDNLLLGFIFVKFAQPKRRQKTVMFSKNACITYHDGELAVQVRVGDMRKSHLLDAQVHGVLIRRYVTQEGILYPVYLSDIKFQADNMDDKIILMWPMVLTHKITEDSPFWDIKPADLCSERYELIIYIEGTIESTGEFCQARTSYTPREFLWGHRFDRIEEFDAANGRWEIDFGGFNDVVYCTNIRHSAQELATFKDKKVHFYDTDDDETGDKKVVVNKTFNLKSVSYDVVPELPARDSLAKRIRRLTQLGAKKADKNKDKSGSKKVDVNADSANADSKRDSIISTDEKSYQTADEEDSTHEDQTTDVWYVAVIYI